MQRVTTHDVEAVERDFYAAICVASDSGMLTPVESADAVFRKCSRLLSDVKRMVGQLEKPSPPQHRERFVPYAQQSLPFVATPGALS